MGADVAAVCARGGCAVQVVEPTTERRALLPDYFSNTMTELGYENRIHLLSVAGSLEEVDWSDIDRIFNELIVDALTALEGTGCPPSSVSFQFGADLRYRGQQNEVSVVLPEDPRKTRSISQIQTIFEKSYMDHYGVIPSHVPLEVVNWRLVAKGPGQVIQSKKRLDRKVMKTCKHRTVHLWKRDQLVPVFQRSELGLNETIEGPALIEERETTIVILPGWQAINDMHGCIVARLIPGLISDQLLA